MGGEPSAETAHWEEYAVGTAGVPRRWCARLRFPKAYWTVTWMVVVTPCPTGAMGLASLLAAMVKA